MNPSNAHRDRTAMEIVVVDRKRARGGGQVVLEELLRRLTLNPRVGVHVIAHPNAASFITAPADVQFHSNHRSAGRALATSDVRVVANATSDFSHALRVSRELKRSGREVTTHAIVHNYPNGLLREVVTRILLRQFDRTIVVEPGLIRLLGSADVPPWLAPADAGDTAPEPQPFTGVVKCFARPDPSKGLHLLPAIFRELTSRGMNCEVALGDALDGQASYERSLRKSLAPWLVDGRRDPSWLRPGDIFIIPSVRGEAACLSAQEAMLRGAGVVASRVGLMPYLMPSGGAVRTFQRANATAAVDAVLAISHMNPAEFVRACRINQASVMERASLWYQATLVALLSPRS